MLNEKQWASELLLQTNDNVNGLIIFSCLSNIQCLCSVSEIFMDGTYKCCPKFFSRLYTIHGLKNGHYIPLVYALLSGKSESTYRHCISAVIEFCSKHGCQFKHSIVHVDFELSVINVMKEFFPDVIIKGCRFHLAQALWRKIQNIGLSVEYKDPE